MSRTAIFLALALAAAGPAAAELFVLGPSPPPPYEPPFISSSGVVVGGSGPMPQTRAAWCPSHRRPDRVVVVQLPAPVPAPPAQAPAAVPFYGVRLDDGAPAPARPRLTAPPRPRSWEAAAPRAAELDDFDAQVFAEP